MKAINNHLFPIMATATAVVISFVFDITSWIGLLIICLAGIWFWSAIRVEKAAVYILDVKKKEIDGQLNVEFHNIQKSISQLIQSETNSTIKDTQHINSIFNDAIKKLNISFQGMNNDINAQGSVVMSLIERMSPDSAGVGQRREQLSLRQFATEMGGIIDYFVQQLLVTSQESMSMVHRIDDMMEEMAKVENLLSDLKTISDQTNLLALNAAIEAARAGEAGRGFAVVADEVRKLSQNSNVFSDQISIVVSTAVANIQDAKTIAGRMASKDMSKSIESKSRVDNMLIDLNALEDFVSVKLSDVSRITTSINDNVSLAVMSMQFEDIVRQLIETIEKRLSILSEVPELTWGQLGKNLRVINSGVGGDLQKVSDMVNSLSEKFDLSVQSAVFKTDLNDSDIDLF